LERRGSPARLADWAREILAQCETISGELDKTFGGAAYQDAYEAARKLVADVETTPSARVLHAMARNHGNSFLRFVLIESTLHKAALQKLELAKPVREHFAQLAAESLVRQRDLEAADQVDFETFRQRYLAADLLRV
ncbi:MAG TPA: glutamate--cysteine ligase, partial [Burkholderiales bacterium]|nr:glutamate--cysteine ligase [Burkholderiales bacterium]